MKKLSFSLLILILLNGCQTHFPVVSEDIESTAVNSDIACNAADSAVKANYLLYANKMIDAMAQSNTVVRNTVNGRMSLSLSPVVIADNIHSDALDSVQLNQTISNRILRSGLFIIKADSAAFNLSGQIARIKKLHSGCYQTEIQFTLQLKRTDKILWSETKRLN